MRTVARAPARATRGMALERYWRASLEGDGAVVAGAEAPPLIPLRDICNACESTALASSVYRSGAVFPALGRFRMLL